MKKIAALALALCLLALPALAANEQVALQTVRALGILTGDQHGNLNLDDNVTRAQFVKMMVTASNLRGTIGQPGASSPFSDVRASHWASEYIKAAVQAGWFVGYADGTFRPDGNIKTEEAATALLRMLGYTPADLPGVYPAPQMAAFSSLGLGAGLDLPQGQILTRRDCVFIFYNLMTAKAKSGQLYAVTIGYAVTQAGEIDYSSLVDAKLKGPFVAQTADLSDIVSFVPDEIYRAGTLASADALEVYDVVYFHEDLRAVWIYNSRITGVYTGASPSVSSPSSVTVGGISYPVSSANASFKLSSMGQLSLGEEITLILGKSGDVVDVYGGAQASGVFYGIFQGKAATSFVTADGNVKSRDVARVLCTDGIVREFVYEGSYLFDESLIRVTVDEGVTTVARASTSNLSGAFNSAGTTFGGYNLAANVQMLDITPDGGFVVLYPSRMAGYSLKSGDVRLHAFNEDGEISHLIFSDVTGDLADYGIITSVTETVTDLGDSLVYSSIYRYVHKGVPGMLSTTSVLSLREGPAKLELDNGQLTGARRLTRFVVSETAPAYLMSEQRKLAIGEGVQVYLFENRVYTLTTFSDIDDLSRYKLTAHIDSYAAGGRVRVIIAEKVQ